MNIERLHRQYWLLDGAIRSFHLDIQRDIIEVELLVKRIERISSSGPLQNEDLTSCTIKLIFEKLIEVSLFDKFPTQGYYIDFYTFDNGNDGIEVAFNIHDNFTSIYEKPNWCIKAKQIAWKEV